MKLLAAAVLGALALALPTAADAAGVVITPVCNGAACSTGWYRTAVDVSFSVTGSGIKALDCPEVTIDQDTAGQDVSCVVTLTDNTITGRVVTVRRDATPPTTTDVALQRGPDANGWYNHAVGVSIGGSDALSGLASCTNVTYSGPDSAAATVTVSCSDAAGNVAARTVTLQYDATPPTVSPAPSRPPDADGWYNHPFDLAFQGSDAVSGVDSCASASYSGPNAEAATLTGTCRDKAGNEAAPVSFGFKYDSTPPRLAKLSVQSLDKAVTMRWTASADVAEITIVRTRTGVGRAVTVYAGKPLTAFVDRHVQNGKRYTYLVAALDQAGNQVAGRAVAAPDAPLLAPRRGKRVHRATTLRWRPVPRASYYNVQLWRGRSKVLTTWPKGTKLRLDALPPGAYTWFVWPGRGPRAKHRYGALLGRSTFVVTG